MLFFIRCGGSNRHDTSFKDDIKFTKSGKLGINDIAIAPSNLLKQKKPMAVFDDANGRLFVVWVEENGGIVNIMGKWIYVKTLNNSSNRSFSFPVSITQVIAYDNSENEITSLSVSGLGGRNLTINNISDGTFLFFSDKITVQSDIGVGDSGSYDFTPVGAFGADYSGKQNIIVLWVDYKNDGASRSNPKIVGKVYDKNCSELRKIYISGSSNSFFTYSSSLYNLERNIVSKGQVEPSIAFDKKNKRFIVVWVDINDMEYNYHFAPSKSYIQNLDNTIGNASSAVFSSDFGIVDDKIVVYRYFDVDGNPIKDSTSGLSVFLYSDIDVGSSTVSNQGGVTVNLNDIESFKGEKAPKVIITESGDPVIAYNANLLSSSAFFNYSSDGLGSNYINRGPFSYKVTKNSSVVGVFIRKIKSPKFLDRKLYESQLVETDKAVYENADKFNITLAGGKTAAVFSQNEGGIEKIKVLPDVTVPSSLIEIEAEKDGDNPYLSSISNDTLVAYERYNRDTMVRDIYGRYLSQSQNFKINTGLDTKNYSPAIIPVEEGKFFILFEKSGNIYGTIYTTKTPIVKPSIYLNYTTIDFGSVYLETNTKKYLSVTNIGNGDLKITNAQVSAPFSALSSIRTIGPGSTSTIGVVFNPLAVGAFSSRMILQTNDSLQNAVGVVLRGVAQAGVIINSNNFIDKTDIKSDYFYKFTASTPSAQLTNYEWSVVKGALPDGISLDKNTGILSGKATKTGTFEFEIKAKETYSGLTSSSTPFRIVVYDDIAYAEKESFKCFIATAAYGSYLHPHVETLKKFRDRVLLGTVSFTLLGHKFLLENYAGKKFVIFYYKYSPPVAAFIGKHNMLKFLTRLLLTPLIFGIKYFEQIFLLSLCLTVVYFIKKK